MNDHDDIDDAQATQIDQRIGQAFAFARDVIDDPRTLDAIPGGSTLIFRDVVVRQPRLRLTAYPAKGPAPHWEARVTGPAAWIAEQRRLQGPAFETRSMGRGASTSAERGKTAAAALDALEATLRNADHPDLISCRAAQG